MTIKVDMDDKGKRVWRIRAIAFENDQEKWGLGDCSRVLILLLNLKYKLTCSVYDFVSKVKL